MENYDDEFDQELNSDYVVLSKRGLMEIIRAEVQYATSKALSCFLSEYDKRKIEELEEPQWVTGATLCRIIGISRQTLHNWRTSLKMGPFIQAYMKGSGQSIRYDAKRIKQIIRKEGLLRNSIKM
jgi:hypothetical protein